MTNSRDSKTGRFIRNENRWEVKGNCIFCYLENELLFFTDRKNAEMFLGLSVSKSADGYSAVTINKKEISVHRYLTNAPENTVVDHINRNKKDNRIKNLRIVDKSINAFNSKTRIDNKSGCKGVWYRKDTGKWCAEIKKNYKKISLGCFQSKAEAIEARKNAEAQYYG